MKRYLQTFETRGGVRLENGLGKQGSSVLTWRGRCDFCSCRFTVSASRTATASVASPVSIIVRFSSAQEVVVTATMNGCFSIGLTQGQWSLMALTRILHYLQTVLADFPSTTAFSAADHQCSHWASRQFSSFARVGVWLARIERRDDECNLD